MIEITDYTALHYSVAKLDDVSDIWTLFPDGDADEMNWLFVGTSGIHGGYETLEDAKLGLESGDESECYLTILVVQPRRVRTYYGQIKINDISELEKINRILISTAKVIQEQTDDYKLLKGEEPK